MEVIVKKLNDEDLLQAKEIWNEVVKEGLAFPQEEELTLNEAKTFFNSQSFTGVAKNKDNEVVGLYILHPNNIGRCGHISNASYAVRSDLRGNHIGEKLVKHSLKTAKDLGFTLMQFNAVVKNNTHARNLYKRIGFKELGVIPHGFRFNDGVYEDIYPYIFDLDKI